MVIALGLLDAPVGGYLVWYARRRQHRDREGVLVVGVVLLLCAVALLASTVLLEEAPSRPPVGDV